ncbi:MAG TPA: T9SS type A sorting domain-containing protein [Ignavibacteriaceae bacterium]|nr:T9SS type A sorting domain-containing protein [Ignavibacteriaceae bacterium]
MKIYFSFFRMLLLSAIIMHVEVFAQDFFTGKVGVTLSGAGRIRVFSDSLITKQIERTSVIVGTGSETVFTYNEDADNLIPVVNVTSPQFSEFEMVGTANNSYSLLPPNVTSRANVYGWVDGSYILVKYTITNDESFDINAFIGMETIAEIDGSAGLETVQFYPFENIVSFYRAPSSHYTGCKILSSNFFSSRTFDWSADYDTSDSFLYSLLTSGTIDTIFEAQGDGAVAIYNQNSVSIASGDSTTFWMAISVGQDETGMLENMDEAVSKYQLITEVKDENHHTQSEYFLSQNYPNPFNPSTTISFSIPSQEKVKLQVFNALGQEVALLLDKEISAGSYNYTFDASGLTSGIYFYTLSTGTNSITKKMILIK